MREIRSFPYLTPKDKHITTVNPWRFFDDDTLTNPETFFKGWDPSLSVDAEITLKADLNSILHDCGLADDARLRLVSGWKSSGTMLRGSGQSADLTEANSKCPVKLRVQADGLNISQDITLFAGIILVIPGTSSNPLCPKLPGSVLWSTEYRVLLDDWAVLFPTEMLDFGSKEWPIPENAVWYFLWDPNDLHQTLFGDTRLYLNSSHPAVVRAVSNAHTSSTIIQHIIFFDLARTLITGALSNSEFVAHADEYPDGTIGAVIRDMIYGYFPGRSLETLKAMSSSLVSFEAHLQHHLNFLEG